jgi:hypothetical protein
MVSLGCGVGLPGIVSALAPADSHVCTCASGGSHATCPVCNPGAHAHASHRVALDGVPCGEKRIAVGDGCGPVVAASAPIVMSCPFARLRAEFGVTPAPADAPAERSTPPPRTRAV